MISKVFTSLGKKSYELAENFEEVSGVFGYYINGEVQDIKTIPKLTESNFKFYVGKSRNPKESQFYSDEFYIESIRKILKKSAKNSIITISVGGDLKDLLNPKNSNNDLTINEQIGHIKHILNTYFSKYRNNIFIEKISDSHQELFQKLTDTPSEEENTDNIEKYNKINSSKDIYNLLLKAFNSKNIQFNQKVEKTIPKKLKNNETSNYYPLAEIAFRIQDYIDGFYIHGGERRQEEYDFIIRGIINGKFNQYEELEKIYKYVKTKNIKNSFSSIHFNKTKFEKEKVSKKLRNTIGKTVLSISLIIGGGYGIKNHYDNLEQERFEQKIDKLILNNLPKINLLHDNWMYSHDFNIDGYDINQIKQYTEDLTNTFLSLYGDYSIGDKSKKYKDMYFLILNDILNSNNFFEEKFEEKFPSYYDFNSKFIKYFIDNNKVKLLQEGFELDNNNLHKYKEIIFNSSNINKEYSDLEKQIFSDGKVNKIGVFNVEFGNYEIGFVNIDGKDYIVARYIINLSTLDQIELAPGVWKNIKSFDLSEGKRFSDNILKFL